MTTPAGSADVPRPSGAPADPLHPWLAAALVFGASAAVLVVEIVALRLLAPYLGLTLETSTLVIGVALAAIASGSWVGGRAADVVSPRSALGPLLAVSGVVVAITPAAVRTAGEVPGGPVLLVAVATVFAAGAALSAVTPMVTKLQLTSLGETGSVVGRLSGVGTAGAILGTVVTGFVLISRLSVSAILVGLGIALVVAAAGLELVLRHRRPGPVPVMLVVLGGLTAAAAPGGCDVETVYHCAEVRHDPENDGGRLLVLDGVHHSYVDIDDPTHLEFRYVRAVAAALDATFAADEPLTSYHLGAGGLTVPRYLDAVRPGSRSLVSEIDPGVVAIDRDLLELPEQGISVRVEDGRRGLARVEGAAYDLVVGDAFGGVSVPWHLTTREALAQVRRALAPDGVYVMNLIDHGDVAFARAAVATLDAVFDHVVVAADADTLARRGGGNLVAVAAERPVDAERWTSEMAARDVGWEVLDDRAADAWTRDATILRDDRAPVDQLLTPYPVR